MPAARRRLWLVTLTWGALALAGSGCNVAPGERRAAASESGARELDAVRARGRELFFGRAGCHACHRIGDEGTQVVGPNLGVGDDFTEPVGRRQRVPGMSAADYVVTAIVTPDATVVSGYPAGRMPRVMEPPLALGCDDVVALALFVLGVGSNAAPVTATEEVATRARLAALRPECPPPRAP